MNGMALRAQGRAAIVAIAIGVATLPVGAQNDVQGVVTATFAKYKDLKAGKNADYIPALARVDPNLFGIAVVGRDGKAYVAGDVNKEVSIQSISKVFTMARVIEDQGPDAIEKTIGVDATGMRFNSIIAVELGYKVGGGPELNPLVNPGAITATSMVQGATADAVWAKIIGTYGDFAGHSLRVLEDVYKSESDSNQRNQAIGILMHAYGYIKQNPAQATDLYTRQCSVGVTAKDLAMMAATLAFGGRNPVTGKQAISTGNCRMYLPSWPLPDFMTIQGSGCTRQDSRRRVASAAASSLSHPASSASRLSRLPSMRPATASARRGRSQRSQRG
jgi:glutaminase